MTKQQQLSQEIKEAQARLEALKSQEIKETIVIGTNAKTGKEDRLNVKIGPKGGLVIAGLGRHVVNLYPSQAARLQRLMNSSKFQEFMEKNQANFAKKEEQAAE